MTTRKLTPAEALAALRSRYDSDRTYEPWARILEEFGNGDPSKFAGECWSVLESALAQKPPAAPELGDALNFGLKYPPPQSKVAPAAPVPSDEEIVRAIDYCGKLASHAALRLLARRIGVQGVPQ